MNLGKTTQHCLWLLSLAVALSIGCEPSLTDTLTPSDAAAGDGDSAPGETPDADADADAGDGDAHPDAGGGEPAPDAGDAGDMDAGDADSGPFYWGLQAEGDHVYQEGARAFVTLGERVTLRLFYRGALPAGASIHFESLGKPPVKLVQVPGDEYAVSYLVEGMGVVRIRATLRYGDTNEQFEVAQFVVHEMDRAIFFDPVHGDDGNTGSLDSPRKDPALYLEALSASSEKRHLYVRAGDVAHRGIAINSSADSLRGADRIIVTGGYGPSEHWERDPLLHRTRFAGELGLSEVSIGNREARSDVVFDGLTFQGPQGITCSGSDLRLLNVQLEPNHGAGLSSVACAGLVAGSVIFGGSDAAAIEIGPSEAQSRLRIVHNLLLAFGYAEPYFAGQRLGDDVRFNAFYRYASASTVIVHPAARELDGNLYLSQAGTPTNPERLEALNQALMPAEPNIFTSDCFFPAGPLDVGTLRSDARLTLGSQQSCFSQTPLPFEALNATTPLDHYALRFDRRGNLRLDQKRMKGPEEHADSDGDGVANNFDGCPLDSEKAPAYGHCPDAPFVVEASVSKRFPKVGERVTVRTLTSGAAGRPMRVRAFPAGGMDAEIEADDEAGVFHVTGRAVGATALRLVVSPPANDTSPNGVHGQVVVRIEFRPSHNLRFVDFYAPSGGDGSEQAPYSTWPLVHDASELNPVDLIFAESVGHKGAKLPASGWLPPHVRVFGGYTRDPDGTYRRRAPVVDSNLAGENGVRLVVGPGSPSDHTATRVLDGVMFGPSTASVSEPILTVSGPLLISRSRLWDNSPSAPAILTIGASSANVAVVGSSITYAEITRSSLPLVRLKPGAAPTFLFNDFHRRQRLAPSPASPVGAAIYAESDLSGAYAANRYWVANSVTSDRYAFFALPKLENFLPTLVLGNGQAPSEWSHANDTALFADDKAHTWLDAVDRARQQPVAARPNVDDAACGTPQIWVEFAPHAQGLCAGGAGDAAERARALEDGRDAASRNGLDLDYLGRQRPSLGADIGATQRPRGLFD